jgi:hypothetical protein
MSRLFLQATGETYFASPLPSFLHCVSMVELWTKMSITSRRKVTFLSLFLECLIYVTDCRGKREAAEWTLYLLLTGQITVEEARQVSDNA